MVTPQRRRWTFAQVRDNCARFGRARFGSASQMRVVERARNWLVEVRTEGHPAHDPGARAAMLAAWERFFVAGFGSGAKVVAEVKIEAGDQQDGRPSAQVIIMPPPDLRIE